MQSLWIVHVWHLIEQNMSARLPALDLRDKKISTDWLILEHQARDPEVRQHLAPSRFVKHYKVDASSDVVQRILLILSKLLALQLERECEVRYIGNFKAPP